MKRACIGLHLSVFFMLLVLSACGKSSSGTSVQNAFSDAIAAVVVTSPTAASSTPTASLAREKGMLWAFLRMPLIQWVAGFFTTGARAVESTTLPTLQPIKDAVNTMKNHLSATDASTVVANMNADSFFGGKTTNRAECYGPAWTDNASGSTVNRPSGDLGIVSPIASPSDSTACSVAQLNAILYQAKTPLESAFKYLIGASVGGSNGGKSLPANVGDVVDVTANVPAVTGVTLTSAKLTRLADSTTGYKVYQWTVLFTVSSVDSEVTAYFSPRGDSATVTDEKFKKNFRGLLKMVLPHQDTGGGGARKRGYSLVFDQTDGVLTLVMDTAANRNSTSAEFFNTSGRVDYSKSAFGEDAHAIRAVFNSVTNAATTHYAWQAGANDGAARAFSVNISPGTEGSLTGSAWFGFSVAIRFLDDDGTRWPYKMHCNWVNGLSNSSAISKVQRQVIIQSEGKFGASSSKISFAPTDSCSRSSNWTVTNSQPSRFDGDRTGGVPTHDLEDGPTPVVVGTVTVPTIDWTL